MGRFLAQLLFWVVTSAMVRPIKLFLEEVVSRSGVDDPVYKKNVEKLIERNRRFEETKE
jgi:hypothetical protein